MAFGAELVLVGVEVVNLGVGVEGSGHGLEGPQLKGVIVIQQYHEISGGGLEGLLGRNRDPAVLFTVHDADAGIECRRLVQLFGHPS